MGGMLEDPDGDTYRNLLTFTDHGMIAAVCCHETCPGKHQALVLLNASRSSHRYRTCMNTPL